MAETFDKLPGILLPVREVTSRLASMWEGNDSESPMAFRASQMNVVLHLGLSAVPAEARERFDALVRFAQRYPSRIIVLCATAASLGNGMESKLFSQCYIGVSHREMCCCEALILRYNPENSKYLFDQVSTWIEGDLPVYYWFSQVQTHYLKTYLHAVRKFGVRRYVFDSSVEPDTLETLSLPVGCQARDLADVRLLPLRQNIGKFLSRYSVSDITEGLQRVRIVYCCKWAGEGSSLLRWVKSCLRECMEREQSLDTQLVFELEADKTTSNWLLKIEFIYKNDKYFLFKRSKDEAYDEMKADLGQGSETTHIPVKLLSEEQLLADAFFQ